MYHYAQIKKSEDGYGYVIGESWLSGEVIEENMVLILNPIDYINHRWNYETKRWEVYTSESKKNSKQLPTQLDRIEAAVNQKTQDIAAAAVDAYTLELLEGGLL